MTDTIKLADLLETFSAMAIREGWCSTAESMFTGATGVLFKDITSPFPHTATGSGSNCPACRGEGGTPRFTPETPLGDRTIPLASVVTFMLDEYRRNVKDCDGEMINPSKRDYACCADISLARQIQELADTLPGEIDLWKLVSGQIEQPA